MKLITWNIQWELGMDGRCDLARVVADARRLADFDVLCLQEVSDHFPELRGTRGANQFAELAKLMPGYVAIEGVALDIPDGQGRRKRFGNMVLSRSRSCATPCRGAPIRPAICPGPSSRRP